MPSQFSSTALPTAVGGAGVAGRERVVAVALILGVAVAVVVDVARVERRAERDREAHGRVRFHRAAGGGRLRDHLPGRERALHVVDGADLEARAGDRALGGGLLQADDVRDHRSARAGVERQDLGGDRAMTVGRDEREGLGDERERGADGRAVNTPLVAPMLHMAGLVGGREGNLSR